MLTAVILLLQKHKPARGPTAEEFAKEVLCPAVEVAKTELIDMLDDGVQPLISFDNDRIHTSALKTQATVLSNVGWDAATMRCELSPYSPDMHRVIEHTHGLATLKFRQWLYQNPTKHSVAEYKSAFESIYRQCCTPDVIAKDVAGLPEVYNYVATHGGEWATDDLR